MSRQVSLPSALHRDLDLSIGIKKGGTAIPGTVFGTIEEVPIDHP